MPICFLQEELLDFVQKGFWLVLPCRLLMKKYKRLLLLRNLRISPMGVVPGAPKSTPASSRR
jgi:hypothetical protein